MQCWGSENWSAADRLRNLTRIIPEGLIILAKIWLYRFEGKILFLTGNVKSHRDRKMYCVWALSICLCCILSLGAKFRSVYTSPFLPTMRMNWKIFSLSRLTWRVSLTLDTLHVIATSVHGCSLRTLSEALENNCSLSNADIGSICSGDIFKSYDLLVNFL